MSNLATVTHISQGKKDMPSKNGYVKLWRDAKNQPFWKKDLEAKSIFIELLMLAQHTHKAITYKGKALSLKSGQLVISRSELGELSGVDSDSKVKRCLAKFEKLGQIGRENVKHNGHFIGQIITFLNWEKWQKSDQSTDQSTDQPRTAEIKALKGYSDQPIEQPTDQHSNNVSNNKIKEYAGSETPLNDFLEIRESAFEHFWKTWSEAKKLVGLQNTAPKAKTKSKFMSIFPASKIRSIGEQAFDEQINAMSEFAWNAHSDIASKRQIGESSDWFNHEKMWPAKFLGNRQWEEVL